MQLMLLRHGIAEDAHESPDGSDAARRLTAEGVTRTRKVVQALAATVEKPDVILTSPRVRARQTADLAAEAFDAPVREVPALGVGDVAGILAAVREAAQPCVMIVGHEPTFSSMVEWICFGRSTGHVDMKKAGCAAIDVQWTSSGQPSGYLLWLVTPGLLLGSR